MFPTVFRATSARSFSTAAVRMAGGEGSTGSSQGFGKREQAEEGAYAKKQEQAQLLKLKEQLAKTEAEKADLQEKLKRAEANTK